MTDFCIITVIKIRNSNPKFCLMGKRNFIKYKFLRKLKQIFLAGYNKNASKCKY